MKKNVEIKNRTSLQRVTLLGLIVTIGIVFGDIGTSPLYVMKAIVGVDRNYDSDYIIGAISCIIWTLTLQTTVKYVLLALRADNNGEGGILALFALLRRMPRRWLYIVAAIGAAALIADGIITPAITVTSAIEGLKIVWPTVSVVPIVVVVVIVIFMMQQAGTGRIGRFFGPFMLLWFLSLGGLGLLFLFKCPMVLKAFNPWYAICVLVENPMWFFILGAVFLCTTGAEALYSDLGHCGRRNITVSWLFVKSMLILNYLGQGAWLILAENNVPAGVNPFYAIIPADLTVIGVIMSTGAAVIASQALLSGSFTIFSEAVNLDFWPKLKIKYPSNEKGQLYIPAINWALLAGCILTIAIFRDSSHMEAAYGLAITVTMLMTTILLTFWMRFKGINKIVCICFFSFFTSLEGLFFVANLFKFEHGGWYSLLIASVLAAVMVVWHKATGKRAQMIEYRPLAECSGIISAIKNDSTIPKYASNVIYFSRSSDKKMIETKLIYSIVNKRPKRADHYWFIHVEYVDIPDTLEYDVEIISEHTIYLVTMRFGFRVAPKVSVYLRQVVEDLVADGRLDLLSTYPSLRGEGIAGDFHFVMLHRIFSASSSCRRSDRFLLLIHGYLRKIGLTDHSAFGLDTSVVTVETVPLVINNTPGRRIRRIDR